MIRNVETLAKETNKKFQGLAKSITFLNPPAGCMYRQHPKASQKPRREKSGTKKHELHNVRKLTALVARHCDDTAVALDDGTIVVAPF